MCLSDSEDTLSAASDREASNEAEGKNSKRQIETTRREAKAATQRREREEISTTERKRSRGSSRAVCDTSNPAPTSERHGRDASLKANQARKLLAKVWLTRVSLFDEDR